MFGIDMIDEVVLLCVFGDCVFEGLLIYCDDLVDLDDENMLVMVVFVIGVVLIDFIVY